MSYPTLRSPSASNEASTVAAPGDMGPKKAGSGAVGDRRQSTPGSPDGNVGPRVVGGELGTTSGVDVGPRPPGMRSKDHERAKEDTERHIVSDNQRTELAHVLAQLKCTTSGINDETYSEMVVDRALVSPARPPRKMPLALAREVEQYRCSRVHGLFPEIGRAWFAVDNKLYLWDYEGGVGQSFRCMGPVTDQIVVAVGLVRPRADVFDKSVPFLMVITTPVEVTVLSVTFDTTTSGEQGRGSADYGSEMQLLPTMISLPTDGTTMACITGTPEGRIFLGGSDGHVCELVYRADDGWNPLYRRQFWLERSLGQSFKWRMFGVFLPGFVGGGHHDGVRQIAHDPSRHILYALTRQNAIQVFDLGSTGCDSTLISTHVDRYAEARARAVRDIGSAAKGTFSDDHSINSISVVSTSESSGCHLIAFTSSGARMFYTTTPPTGPHSLQQGTGPRVVKAATVTRPSKLTLMHVRLSELRTDLDPKLTGIHERGVSVFTTGERCPEGVCLVTWLGPDVHDSQHIGGHTPAKLEELYSHVRFDGVVAAMAPVACTDVAHADQAVAGRDSALSALVWQHETRPLELVFLTLHTEAGVEGSLPQWRVQYVEKLSPRAALAQMLRDQRGGDHELMMWRNRWSPVEFCVLCLSHAASSNTVDAHASTAALLKYGGSPNIDDHQEVVLSFKYHAAIACFARIVSLLWDKPLCVATPPSTKHTGYDTRYSKEYLQQAANRLAGLSHFVTMNMDVLTAAGQGNADAHKAEAARFLAFAAVLRSTLHAVSLWATLAGNNLGDIVMKLKPSRRETVARLKFGDFATVSDGKIIASHLINELIGNNVHHDNWVDNMCQHLEANCSEFFDASDRKRSMASAYLDRAIGLQDTHNPMHQAASESEVSQLVTLAVNMYKETISHVHDIPEVCDKLRALHHFIEVAELALLRTKVLDPVHKQGERLECLQCVVDCLDDVRTRELHESRPKEQGMWQLLFHKVLQTCNDAKMRDCDRRIYDWLLSQSNQTDALKRISEMRSVYVEEFLKEDLYAMHNVGETLVNYYYNSDIPNKFRHAAKVYQYMAESPCDTGYNLDARIGFLASAMLCAKAGTDHSGGLDGELVTELQDKRDVAMCQRKILSDLQDIIIDPDLHHDRIETLDSGLLGINELYNRYAQLFNLYEAQLLILHVSKYTNVELVHELWDNITIEILRMVESGDTANNAGGVLQVLRDKVAGLGKQIYPSQIAFPLAFVVRHVELCAFRITTGGDGKGCMKAFIDGGVSHTHLFHEYSAIQSNPSLPSNMKTRENLFQIYMINVMLSLVESWLHAGARDTMSRRSKNMIMNSIGTFKVLFRKLSGGSGGDDRVRAAERRCETLEAQLRLLVHR